MQEPMAAPLDTKVVLGVEMLEVEEAGGEHAVAMMLVEQGQVVVPDADPVMTPQASCLMLEQGVTTNKKPRTPMSVKVQGTLRWFQCPQTSDQICAFASYRWPWVFS